MFQTKTPPTPSAGRDKPAVKLGEFPEWLSTSNKRLPKNESVERNSKGRDGNNGESHTTAEPNLRIIDSDHEMSSIHSNRSVGGVVKFCAKTPAHKHSRNRRRCFSSITRSIFHPTLHLLSRKNCRRSKKQTLMVISYAWMTCVTTQVLTDSALTFVRFPLLDYSTGSLDFHQVPEFDRVNRITAVQNSALTITTLLTRSSMHTQ
jgi:hypothetical protein